MVTRGRKSFDEDRATQLAIERLLEIIGEASSRLADETKHRYPGVAWNDVTRLRIVLAHHYHRIDRDQVWTIATSDVPELSRALSGSSGS